MEQSVTIKKMIKEINSGDYSSAKKSLKEVLEAKIQERIKNALSEE